MNRIIFALASVVLLFAACGTIAPKPITETMASYDSGAQNSGLIGFDRDGAAIIASHARDRYNALVAIYGQSYLVPIRFDDGVTLSGITNNTQYYRMDAEHVVKFAEMNNKRKESLK